MRRFSLLACSLAAATLATPALAGLVTIDFETDDDGDVLSNGQILNNGTPGEFGTLFDLFSFGENAGLGIFDSTPGVNGADPDLWVGTGNILIMQNSGSSSTGDFWDAPNDDADGGAIVFRFLSPVQMQSVLLIDIDEGNSMQIFLQDGSGRQRGYDVPSEWTGEIDSGQPGSGTLDLTTVDDQPGFMSAATLLFEDVSFDPSDVLYFTVMFDGAGGLDNVAFLPAPSGLLAMAVGLAGARRRRRTR